MFVLLIQWAQTKAIPIWMAVKFNIRLIILMWKCDIFHWKFVNLARPGFTEMWRLPQHITCCPAVILILLLQYLELPTWIFLQKVTNDCLHISQRTYLLTMYNNQSSVCVCIYSVCIWCKNIIFGYMIVLAL